MKYARGERWHNDSSNLREVRLRSEGSSQQTNSLSGWPAGRLAGRAQRWPPSNTVPERRHMQTDRAATAEVSMAGSNYLFARATSKRNVAWYLPPQWRTQLVVCFVKRINAIEIHWIFSFLIFPRLTPNTKSSYICLHFY